MDAIGMLWAKLASHPDVIDVVRRVGDTGWALVKDGNTITICSIYVSENTGVWNSDIRSDLYCPDIDCPQRYLDAVTDDVKACLHYQQQVVYMAAHEAFNEGGRAE